MKVTIKNNVATYSYKGDLEKEIKKSKKELAKLDELLPFLKFSFEKAKKEYEKRVTRIHHLKSFVKLAEEKKNEEEK